MPLRALETAIRNDKLPRLAYVEPRHFSPGWCSQHPGHNTYFEMDFVLGEEFIASIYNMLLAYPGVFNKTLFLITYDEHGGFYDHVPPPRDARYEVDPRHHYRDGAYRFRFDLLGVRVPAVLVSPRIPRGTVDHTTYDHASIVASAIDLFARGTGPLGSCDDIVTRDGNVNRFTDREWLSTPRTADLPRPFRIANLSALSGSLGPGFTPLASEPLTAGDIDLLARTASRPVEELDDFASQLLAAAYFVNEYLEEEVRAREEGRAAPPPEEFEHPTDAIPPSTTTFGAADAYQKSVMERLRRSGL
jgi:hypothetical protein